MAAAAATPSYAAPEIDGDIVRRHDQKTARLLEQQITDRTHRSFGTLAGPLPSAGGASDILETLTAAFVCPGSRFRGDRSLVQRIGLAAAYLEQRQSPEGNIDLLTTNFNSPPDTAFVVHHVATAAFLAKKNQNGEILKIMEPFLRKAGHGMMIGGVHTPNHRWVISSALAQVHELFPDDGYVRRIDQWLAEGLDLDDDGQWTERSVLVYNNVTDRAFIVLAAKLGRPELLEPVRRNLDSMLYLLHADGSIAAEVARRDSGNTHNRQNMSIYWFPLSYMARHDADGRFAALARKTSPESVNLATLLEYPELQRPLPASAALPDNFEKDYTVKPPFTRIRRGDTSITLLRGGDSRFLAFRRGDASVTVRFANAFFGHSTFTPQQATKRDGGYHFAQSLQAPYYQPFEPGRKVGMEFGETRASRRQSEICHMRRSAIVTETERGLRVRVQAGETANSPLAVEVSLPEDAKIEGCTPLSDAPQSWLLSSGYCTYRTAKFGMRFGPGIGEHEYTVIRGAQAKLPGQSVFLTGFTPFDHTLVFEWL